jgi:type II secretory pathway pseudopilin PulG
MRRGGPRNGGFTIVELLVVIGIIVALVALLLTVVTRIRKAGYNAASNAALAAIQGAVEAYHQNFRAYPGPVSTGTICGQPGSAPMPQGIGSNGLTMSENLLLGLEGGLVNTGSAIVFQGGQVGRGPLALNQPGGKQYTRFLNIAVNKSVGRFSALSQDSNVPEYVDSFPDNPLPFLYYRATIGAQSQYDVLQNLAYTAAPIGPPDPKMGGQHGLRFPGNPAGVPTRNPNDLGPYLNSPTGMRGKDAFILIGAGPDRTYGTGDDITSFGSVLP